MLGSIACSKSADLSSLPLLDETPLPPIVAAGTHRLLGIDVSSPEDGDFDTALGLAKAAGAQVVSLSLAWDVLETEPGVYEPEPNYLAIANQYYSAAGMRVSLVITPIDTNVSRLPADLQDKPFDDPLLIKRFNRLLDWVFSQIPDLRLTSLSIGNEVNVFLGSAPGAWAAYGRFYEATSEHGRGLRPGLRVGAKLTSNGILGYAQSEAYALNNFSDVILVTYYPLNPDFTVREPAVVADDLAALVTAYPGRPIHLAQAGYPSSPILNSSEARQAQFVQEMFEAWDAHASQIELISFTWLSDASPAAVADFAEYYGLSTQRFTEFLASLGLRTFPGSGRDKQAFRMLMEQARARGWIP